MSKPKSDAAHGWDRDECFQEENSMSSPIAPTSIASTPITAAALRAGANAPAPAGASATASAAAVSFDAIPSAPPQEVLDQMASAAAVYERLASQGRELRFARDESGRTALEVRDRVGNVLERLSPTQALELAAGAPLE
jgi:hypothetical protein